MYQQQMQPYRPQTMNNITWVQGIEGAKAYQLSPNTNVQLMDSENDGIFYIKTSDNIGMCNLRVFKYEEIKETPSNQIDTSQFVTRKELIPQSWYQYTRQDVDTSIKRNAVKNGLTMWVDWERDTKELYEKMYKELLDIDEIASAMKIKELICDVDCELKKAERYELNKKATDYDIVQIIDEQDKKHHKYEKKMKEIGVHLC